MNEKGFKPQFYKELGYNESRDVPTLRQREWAGYSIPNLEMKKPNQFKNYQDMIYTYDLKCMQKPYPMSRKETMIPLWQKRDWTPVPPWMPKGWKPSWMPKGFKPFEWELDGDWELQSDFDGGDFTPWIPEPWVPKPLVGWDNTISFYYSLDGANWVLMGEHEYIKATHSVAIGFVTGDVDLATYADDFEWEDYTSFSDDFTGADHDPPDGTKWTNDSCEIISNTLRYTGGGGPG
jgi:hypothetical protein